MKNYRVPWIAVALGLLAVITLIITLQPDTTGIVPMMEGVGGGGGVSDSSAQPIDATMGMPASPPAMVPQAIRTDYYPGYQPNPPISDSREFQKVYYNATIQTRHVQEDTARVETIVRGHGGRVDQTSSSRQYGSITFVVPVAKFQDFRTEIESLVPARFLSVDISSQNMLYQKRSIEEQKKQADQLVADLTAQHKRLVASHAEALKSLQGRMDANSARVQQLRAQEAANPALRENIDPQIAAILAEQAELEASISDENASYKDQLASLEAQLKYAAQSVDSVKRQDKDLTDDVGTVQGTISLRWISWWDMAHLYLPDYWIPVILAILAGFAYWWERRSGTDQS